MIITSRIVSPLALELTGTKKLQEQLGDEAAPKRVFDAMASCDASAPGDLSIARSCCVKIFWADVLSCHCPNVSSVSSGTSIRWEILLDGSFKFLRAEVLRRAIVAEYFWQLLLMSFFYARFSAVDHDMQWPQIHSVKEGAGRALQLDNKLRFASQVLLFVSWCVSGYP